jgi:hypothetical protein
VVGDLLRRRQLLFFIARARISLTGINDWKSLSVAVAFTLLNFYFRINAGTIKKEQVIDF